MIDPKIYALFVALFTAYNIYSLFAFMGFNFITLLNIGFLYVSYHILKMMYQKNMYPFNHPKVRKFMQWFR